MENRREFGIAIAHYLMASNGNRDVAVTVALEANIPNTRAFAVSTAVSGSDTRTSIVNLLQNCSENGIRAGNEIYTTEVPSTSSIGIAKAQGVRYIYFVTAGQLCVLDTQPNPVPTIDNRQAVNLVARPPSAERLVPALPDVGLNWLTGGRSARGVSAALWHGGLPAPGPGDTSRSATALRHAQNNLTAARTGVLPYADFRLDAPTPAVPGATPAFRDRLFMSLVRVIASRGWQHAPGGSNLRTALGGTPLAPGKNIAAVLVNPDNQIFAWGLNTNDNATTRHAETNAIQSFQNGRGTDLPDGTIIYSTLDPCFMCAALYVQAGGQHCLYEQADPNMTHNTALGHNAVQYHEAFTGPLGAPATSVAQTLDTGYTQSGLPRVPDYLRTDQALHVYSYAHERLVTTGMRARTADDRQLFQHVLDFLRTTGYLGGIGARPDLILDDDVASRVL